MDAQKPLKPPGRTAQPLQDPADIRAVFGHNLRQLIGDYPSVASLCRDIGINRTQFNRYLSGDSFPRPDILQKICTFFDVDARILLEPLDHIPPTACDLINHPMLSGFFGQKPLEVTETAFPSGFYRFVRQSFIGKNTFMMGLVHVYRKDGYTFLRGYVPFQALRAQGLSAKPGDREYRGFVMRQEEGVMAVVTHRNALACSFNFLAPETSFQSNLWEGYATRTVREKVTGRRVARMVYEYLGLDRRAIMDTARDAGLVPIDQVPPFFTRLLQPDQEFR